jgi:ABC-type Fe3+/spermidine/putrescine transport system ATPase subunit
VFERPATEFVAEFMGAGNFFARGDGGRFIVRPERLHLSAPKPGGVPIQAMPDVITNRVYQGITTQWLVRTDAGADLTVTEQNDHTSQAASLHAGDRAWIAWRPEDAVAIRPSSSRGDTPAGEMS